MESHDLWHVAVLGSTLFGAAGLLIVGLAPLVSDERPRIARVGVALLVVAVVLLLLEWLVVH